QLLRLGEEGHALLVEAVLGVLLGHEAELVHGPVVLLETGVDLGELQVHVQVGRIQLEARLEMLAGLVIALQHDQVVDRVLLILLLLLLLLAPTTKPALDAQVAAPPEEENGCTSGCAADALSGRRRRLGWTAKPAEA